MKTKYASKESGKAPGACGSAQAVKLARIVISIARECVGL
jgi:hypothetical protein